MKRLFFFVGLFLAGKAAQAQCAMCRTQVENNVSDGGMSLAEGLNTGILYLFITPYIAIGVVAFFWYRQSKHNERKVSFGRRN